MLEYVKDLLDDLKRNNKNILNQKQKSFALETAIEILEKFKNKE